MARADTENFHGTRGAHCAVIFAIAQLSCLFFVSVCELVNG